VQLHSKYASETDMSDTFSEHKDEMESILQAVEAKISAERQAAQTQHDADVASSLAKKNSDVADCNAAEQAVIDKWDSKIADAQAAWDAAAVVEATEIAEYKRLFAIRVTKQELYDAAVHRQAVEGALARSLHKDDVDGAWDYYTSMHGSITSIATADYAYLTEELESLQTVLDIVNQLNLDGNNNGEHVAAEHVTNDYATDAAEAKPVYHGATINESNSEPTAEPTAAFPAQDPSDPGLSCTAPDTCVFPFTYYGVEYNACTSMGKGGVGVWGTCWCSTATATVGVPEMVPGSGDWVACQSR